MGKRTEAARSTFAALGDRTRLHIVELLAREGPGSITDLAAAFSVSRQAVTKHLRVLADAEIVESRRVGRAHVFALRTARLDEARLHLEDMSNLSAATDESRRALREEMEQLLLDTQALASMRRRRRR